MVAKRGRRLGGYAVGRGSGSPVLNRTVNDKHIDGSDGLNLLNLRINVELEWESPISKYKICEIPK
jgi:hypothetical protein